MKAVMVLSVPPVPPVMRLQELWREGQKVRAES
jgi:hypothetical protein